MTILDYFLPLLVGVLGILKSLDPYYFEVSKLTWAPEYEGNTADVDF